MKSNQEFESRFLQNEYGKINFTDGSDLNCDPTRVIPKYETKSCFLFGVSAVKLQCGEVVGKKLKPFCYTEKKIFSHTVTGENR